MIFSKINFTKFKRGGMKCPRKIFEKLFFKGDGMTQGWNDSVQYGNYIVI